MYLKLYNVYFDAQIVSHNVRELTTKTATASGPAYMTILKLSKELYIFVPRHKFLCHTRAQQF